MLGDPFKFVVLHDAETGTADGVEMVITDTVSGNGSQLGIQLEGINGETITWEACIGTAETWAGLQVIPRSTGTAATTATANGLYYVDVRGLRLFRARISTGGSGSVTATALLAYDR